MTRALGRLRYAVVASLVLCLQACGSDEASDGSESLVELEYTVDYRSGESCWSRGYPRFDLVIDVPNDRASIDLLGDDVPDVARVGSDLYFAASAFPSLENADADWVVLSLSSDQSLRDFVQSTEMGRAAYTLMSDAPLEDPLAAITAVTDGKPTGERPVDPADESSPTVSWSSGADGLLSAIDFTSTPGEGATHIAVTRPATRPFSPVGDASEDDVMPLENVGAAGVIETWALVDSDCSGLSEGESRNLLECLREVVGEATIGEVVSGSVPGPGSPEWALCQV